MNKRISDTEIENRLKYFVPVDSETIENMLLDLKDARVVVKKYESMMVNKNPSLTEYLQNLANKHKVCFALNQLQILVMYDRGAFFIVNAEEFFGFKKGDFTCDIEVNDVIYPEVTDE